MTWQLIQALFLFALVLGLAWISTRFVATRMNAPGRGRLLRVLEHVPAGRDRSIMLLEVGGKIYLVGATGEQIRLLDTIADAEAVQRMMERVPSTPTIPLGDLIPHSFKAVLSRVMAPGAAQSPAQPQQQQPPQADQPAGAPADEAERLRQQIERLRRIQKPSE
jgi:flagellar biosynthetic protein FliO